MKTAIAFFATALSIAAIPSAASAKKPHIFTFTGLQVSHAVANANRTSGFGLTTNMTYDKAFTQDASADDYALITALVSGGSAPCCIGIDTASIVNNPQSSQVSDQVAEIRTSFGTRTGGVLKLASVIAKANPTPHPGASPLRVKKQTFGPHGLAVATSGSSKRKETKYTPERDRPLIKSKTPPKIDLHEGGALGHTITPMLTGGNEKVSIAPLPSPAPRQARNNGARNGNGLINPDSM